MRIISNKSNNLIDGDNTSEDEKLLSNRFTKHFNIRTDTFIKEIQSRNAILILGLS